MAVYVRDKLLSRSEDIFIIKGGETLTELVERTSLPPVLHDFLRVSIDGVVIPHENWMTTQATAKNVVYMAVVPQGGGDGGKNPLAAIAMVALAVFSVGVITPWASILTGSAFGGAAVAAGVMFVGMLAINALFPPPSSSSESYGDSSGFNGMEGLRNRSRPHAAVRNVFGEYRVSPDLGAEPYVLTSGDTQTLYGLYDFGYGEIEISNVLIGNTPIEHYRGANYVVHTNYTDGDLELYKNDNVTETFTSEIKNNWVERTCPSDESDEAHIDIQFPLGLAKYPEEGGMANDTAIFRLQFGKTDGSTGWLGIGSLRHFFTSHTISEDTITYAPNMTFTNLYTVVAGAGGYTQMKSSDTFIVTNRGTVVDQYTTAPYPNPVRVGQTFYLSGEEYTIDNVVTGANAVIAINDVNGDSYDQYREVSYTITLDRVTTAQPAIPNVYTYFCYTTLIIDTYVEICTWAWTTTTTISSVTLFKPDNFDLFQITRAFSKPFILSLNLGFPEQGEWDVRILRNDTIYYEISAGWDDKFADKTVLKAIQSVTYRQPMDFRVGHTILEMSIRATDQLNGIVDTLTAFCRRKLAYWTGSAWDSKYTNNPAWIALDILMGDANPDPIPESRIDLTGYKAWADFCDTASDQGDDYHHADCNWDGMSTVFERLISVMSAGRATPSMVENKYSVVYEQFPTVPVQLFTNVNSYNFKGSKVFTKQPHAITVSFIDPLAEWQMVDIQVYADGYDELTATYFEKISLPLCTRSDEAWRNGRYYLAQGQLRPESFTLSLDIENLIATRGDLVTVQSDVARAGGTATRLVDVSSLPVVVLKEPVFWDAIDTYKLRIRYDDGTQEEITVTGQTDSYTITLASSPAKINDGDLCVYGVVDYVTDEFLIKTIQPSADLTATLTLVPVARDIATADTGTIPTYTPPISTELMLYPVCLTNVSVETNMYYENRYPYVDVVIRWENIGTNILYEVWYCDDEHGDYTSAGTSKGVEDFLLFERKSTLDKDYFRDGVGYVKVIPMNFMGLKPVFDLCQSRVINFPTDTTVPGKPLFFAGNINADTMNLTWLPPVDVDISGYIIKYTNETVPDWDTATAQGSIIPFNITTASINARIGSYMIKTIDTSGNYSDDFGLIKTTIPALLGFDNFSTVTEDSTFTGVKSNVELFTSDDNDEIVLNGTFDTDTTSWTSGNDAVLSVSGGKLRVTHDGTIYPFASQILTLELNKTYIIKATSQNGTGLARADVDYNLGDGTGNLDSGEFIFTPTTSTLVQIQFYNLTDTIGTYCHFDDVSCKLYVEDGIRLIQDEGSYNPYGVYNFATITDLTDIYNAYISSSLARNIINYGSEITRESDQEVIIQMRMSSDNPGIADWDAAFGYLAAVDASYGYMAGLGANDWSGWQNLTAGYYTGRFFEFRAVLVSNKPYITPHVYELGVKVDMVERTEARNDISSVVNGSTISFTNEFKDIPSIAITQDNMTVGDYFQITNQAVDGFDIEFFDSTDTSVIRQFDYVAVGYGILLTTIENPIEAGDEDDIALLPSATSFITKQNLLT